MPDPIAIKAVAEVNEAVLRAHLVEEMLTLLEDARYWERRAIFGKRLEFDLCLARAADCRAASRAIFTQAYGRPWI